LIVKVVLMVQERMFNVGVAVVAPEREISERENDRVICALHVVRLFHVWLHVARTSNCRTVRLQTNPVLSHVRALIAGVCYLSIFEVFQTPDVLWDAVWTVNLRWNSEKSFNFYHLAFLLVKYKLLITFSHQSSLNSPSVQPKHNNHKMDNLILEIAYQSTD